MDEQEKRSVSKKMLPLLRNLPADESGWILFSHAGAAMSAAGISYRDYGFPKLRPFLNEFQDLLEFRDEQTEGKPPVCYLRLRQQEEAPQTPADALGETAPAPSVQTVPETSAAPPSGHSSGGNGKFAGKNSWLFRWAMIAPAKIQELSELALEERWYYGDTPAAGQADLPILRNYLAYTFKRLVFEHKVLYQNDSGHNNDEYAAFNTGLVDNKYDYIYALFKKNTRFSDHYYWYLLDFVVAGEGIGKTLVRVFNPLPERADYFENKIQNMLYDPTTGDLSCNYTHIITERAERLPAEFLEENCSPSFLTIDGMDLDEALARGIRDPGRKQYFAELGNRIKNDAKILRRLKNRIEDAVELALKKVEWNYKTAIPMYYPSRNTGSLLLPLSLIDEDHVDLALVVERQPSGAYQGQTILPLSLAYSNSRLVTRPDSDWLKTDIISEADPNDLDDE